MGKGTDKLYITHSEWASSDAYSASAGAGVSASKSSAPSGYKRLPFYTCALSLQPFTDPVCTPTGTVFDHTNIIAWLQKHPRKNPVDGSSLSSSDLIKLHFHKSSDNGDFADPVTHKPFTDSSHIVAIRTSGNVFSWETVERLNVKAKLWQDLVSDQAFTKKDIITIQDPMNFDVQNRANGNESKDVNASDVSEKVRKAREALEKSRQERSLTSSAAASAVSKSTKSNGANQPSHALSFKNAPKAQHTTGKAAASFTSTGLTPHTSGERALLTDEEYMLRPKRVKQKGYARMKTSLGDLNIELVPEFAPKAVWNFVKLSGKGYYKGLTFHRNIKGFMIQGGDPTGTGKGGTSIWGSNFSDEFDGPLTHDTRGIVSMANKGKNSNSSQFFITYRAVPHLNRKHTIFGRVVGGLDVLSQLENAPTDDKTNRPNPPLSLDNIEVFIDPFEEFLKDRKEKELADERTKERQEEDEEKVTWTGKRVLDANGRSIRDSEASRDRDLGIGRYLQMRQAESAGSKNEASEIISFDEEEEIEEPPAKKLKAQAGGFGSFDGW